MNLRIKTPRQAGLITVTEDLNGMTWEDAKELLEDNYDIDFDNMAVVLRTQTASKEEKQMIPLTLGQTIIELNEDNVLFMSNSEKIKSGFRQINPDDYPNSAAGLKLLVKDMRSMAIEDQYYTLVEKLDQIDSSLDSLTYVKKVEEDLDDEADEIFNQ